jgi:hypothetical protein
VALALLASGLVEFYAEDLNRARHMLGAIRDLEYPLTRLRDRACWRAHSDLVDDQRPSGMVRDQTIILEPVRARLALAQQLVRMIRASPPGGLFGDSFDIFQNAFVTSSADDPSHAREFSSS